MVGTFLYICGDLRCNQRRKRTSGFNRHILLRANYHGNHSMHLTHNLLWEITLTDTFAIRLSIEHAIR